VRVMLVTTTRRSIRPGGGAAPPARKRRERKKNTVGTVMNSRDNAGGDPFVYSEIRRPNVRKPEIEIQKKNEEEEKREFG